MPNTIAPQPSTASTTTDSAENEFGEWTPPDVDKAKAHGNKKNVRVLDKKGSIWNYESEGKAYPWNPFLLPHHLNAYGIGIVQYFKFLVRCWVLFCLCFVCHYKE
eukprot:GFYU01023262.1.p2 GENE.GFYU01023262.1~~GFYU01023262.1.p2  ORF type:complete len:105 (+),score=23.74 GFYU01023262.1:174-488(+)